jgi:hypothetical protein
MANHLILPNKILYGLLIILLMGLDMPVVGQNTSDTTVNKIADGTTAGSIQVDSVSHYKKHSPTKATIYSMVLPGLGQIYNKKYWKLPIVYAGFGAFLYFASKNNKEYKKYSEAYYHKVENPDGPPLPDNEYETLYDTDYLLDSKNYYRRNRDLSYILTGVWYLLVVVDATVDAHLYTWEVDDDLSLHFEPALYPDMYNQKLGGGLKLSLRF